LARIIRFLILFIFGLAAISTAQVIAPVKVVPARVQPISEIIEGHGIIEPSAQGDAVISSSSPLRIETILVKPGDRVGKDELLVKLQRDKSADMEVEKARITMEQAKINLDRSQNLFDHGVIAKVSLEQAQTENDLAKADYELKKKALDFALANSEIRSPIEGYVSNVSGVVGQIADPTQPILRVVNINELDVAIGIEIEDAAKVQVGQAAEISIPNLPDGNIFKGRIIRSNMAIDTATQLIHIWIKIDNSRGSLKPGLFADAKIFVKTDSSAITVPKSAVLKDAKGPYVYLIDNGTAHKTYVATNIDTETLIQITSGVKPGQDVVYQGNYELDDSLQVEIQK
jgi:membrane fusion protein, multidrug efflux system